MCCWSLQTPFLPGYCYCLTVEEESSMTLGSGLDYTGYHPPNLVDYGSPVFLETRDTLETVRQEATLLFFCQFLVLQYKMPTEVTLRMKLPHVNQVQIHLCPTWSTPKSVVYVLLASGAV